MTGRQRKPSTGDRSTGSASSNSSSNKNNGRRNRNRCRSNSHPVDRPNSSGDSSNGKNNNSNGGNNGHGNRRRDRSNSHHSPGGQHHHHHHHHGPRKPQSKSDLWKGSLKKDIGNSVIVEMVGMETHKHTVYARVDPACDATPEALASVPVGKVIETMVDVEWRHVARAILEQGVHVEPDSYPSAEQLLSLGAVWILNETAYAAGENAHARRLSPKDEGDTPEWKDMTLRVHVHPDRFFVAGEVDWTKYCRGLLLEGGTSAVIGGRKAHVPVTGLPDKKDGVIVYEDKELGFAVINKPGGMPCHSTLSNHAEDVVSMFGNTLKERSGDPELKHPFLSLPFRVETEMHGLLLAATKKEFCQYMTRQIEATNKKLEAAYATIDEISEENSDAAANIIIDEDFTKTYRCLVCIKDPNDIDRMENLVGRIIEHYVDVKSATPKNFVRNKPKSSKQEWSRCLMKITSASSNEAKFRAACVSSKYIDSSDFTLAHRLWTPNSEHPAEDVKTKYVMQIDVRLMTRAPHQIRGQLAAMGFPIVGDGPYGGGNCEMRMHRHMWNRMAVQICHLEFRLPRLEGEGEGDDEKKTELVPTEEDRCVFHLNTAWWSEYLVDYERHLVASDAGL
mmetsp:Transcript_17464/g.37726  ORF Transcript_17464/g.37726 Transcript_17464/m.37726 type:complete len:620 (+) Transcript_17464:181-2040(+)